MILICATLGWPGTSGRPVTSYLSESSQAGPPVICRVWMLKAIVMRSFNVVFTVTTSRPLTVNILPGRVGSLGLIVATSKAGSAFAAIRTGGRGGSGIVHAV